MCGLIELNSISNLGRYLINDEGLNGLIVVG
jgi:hypothetical protein